MLPTDLSNKKNYFDKRKFRFIQIFAGITDPHKENYLGQAGLDLAAPQA